jgi:hypothetical protein
MLRRERRAEKKKRRRKKRMTLPRGNGGGEIVEMSGCSFGLK